MIFLLRSYSAFYYIIHLLVYRCRAVKNYETFWRDLTKANFIFLFIQEAISIQFILCAQLTSENLQLILIGFLLILFYYLGKFFSQVFSLGNFDEVANDMERIDEMIALIDAFVNELLNG